MSRVEFTQMMYGRLATPSVAGGVDREADIGWMTEMKDLDENNYLHWWL